jgi:hypothetical protein
VGGDVEYRLRLKIAVVGIITALLPSDGLATGKTIVVGDVSGSMAGFAKASPRQLQTLYSVYVRNAKTLDAEVVLARMPADKELGPSSGLYRTIPINNFSAFTDSKKYPGLVTPLAEMIRAGAEQFETTVIVTDGLQSENLYLQLGESLREQAMKHMGIWLLLLPLNFSGQIDAEQPLIAENHLPKIEACLNDQSQTVSIHASKPRTIEFSGRRALLSLIISRDVEYGRELVKSIYRDLGAEALRAEWLELSPIHSRGYRVEDPSASGIGASFLRLPSGEGKVLADPDDGGPLKSFRVPIRWNAPAADIPQPASELWGLAKEASPEWARLELPRQVTTPATENEPGSLDLWVNAERTWGEWFANLLPFSGSSAVRDAPLKFHVESQLSYVGDGWWSEWSSDTSWRCPQKVYKLSDLVANVAGASISNRNAAARRDGQSIHLQIGVN